MTAIRHQERLARARIALEGLSIGDGLGGFFEFSDFGNHLHFLKKRRVPEVAWRYTDDTNMALSIYSVLRQDHHINQDHLARNFARHFESGRGYGIGAHALLKRLLLGQEWRALSKRLFNGGSFGNGGAMRVGPLGAYFADDLPLLMEQARLSAEITHAHPEGINGAIAVAVAAALAWQAKQKGERPIPTDFIQAVASHVPDGQVKTGLQAAAQLPSDSPMKAVVATLGNGSEVTAQDSVPIAVWVAAGWLDHYEEAIWQIISAGGDADTTAAMVGGIVASYTGLEGIPQAWQNHREALPTWAFEEETA
jgi:ADP-ribosylglycohydrolase